MGQRRERLPPPFRKGLLVKAFKLNRGDIGLIRKCIAHWRRLRAQRARPLERPTGEWCALCMHYHTWSLSRFCKRFSCTKCPLNQAYGKCSYTSGTKNPWSKARSAWDDRFVKVGRAKFDRAADQMIRCLESLLPKKGRA